MANQNNNAKDKREELGALWARTSKSGSEFLSGFITVNGKKVDVIVFKNSFKTEGSKEADYRIYQSEPRPQNAAPAPKTKRAPAAASTNPPIDEDAAF